MKDNKTISASEISRYLYCNYQWYYERKYGLTELRRRKKEHLKELGIIEDDNPIMRGFAFHTRFGRRLWLRAAYVWLRAAVLIGLFLYFLLTFGIVVI